MTDDWLSIVQADKPLPAWLRRLVVIARCAADRAGDRLSVVIVPCGGSVGATNGHEYIIMHRADFEAYFGAIPDGARATE